jgi:hypothetical protein
MIVYQIILFSEAIFNTIVILLTSLATTHNQFTELSFFFSILFSIYAFTSLIIKLKIEDIAQYEVILIHKDSRVISLDEDTQDIELALSPIDAISIENPILANAELESLRISDTFLSSSEQYFASSKYADQQNELLRHQLREANLIPLEYIPLPQLKQEIDRLIEKINNDQISDEETKRLDYLLICLEKNPEHIEEQQQELQLWLVNSLPFIEESLVTMRGLIPPDIFHCSIATLRSVPHESCFLSK